MKKNKGFTLIELLVVIAIIGILAAIVLVSLSGARNSAKDARMQADMAQLRVAATTYNLNYNSYNSLMDDAPIKSLMADLNTQNSANDYNYATSATDYCVVTKLNTGTYWCVDSALNSKSYAADPATCVAASPKCE